MYFMDICNLCTRNGKVNGKLTYYRDLYIIDFHVYVSVQSTDYANY